jgi:hypothetical protein
MTANPSPTSCSRTPCSNCGNGSAPSRPKRKSFKGSGLTRGSFIAMTWSVSLLIVPDAPEHREFFREYKERLKSRFQQLDIWMVTYPLEVL